uniref:glutathione transferase n=1 Tax=Nyssomyia neivai TaxID=330878 RepID=A0A1L8E4D9_9DIPT
MAPIKFYHMPAGSPSRAVALLVKNLKLDVEVIEVDVLNGEQKSPEFMKINPQHIIPTIDDNGFILWESRAILTYLVTSKAPGHSLYPTDPKIRALIDSRMYFDATVLYGRAREIIFPILFLGAKTVDETRKQAIYQALDLLNTFLDGRTWIAADHPTLADLSILASFTTLVYCGVNVSKYTNVMRWYKRCESLPGFDENENGAKTFGNVVKGKLGITVTWD